VNKPCLITQPVEAGTRFTYPGRMEGWVDMGGWLSKQLHNSRLGPMRPCNRVIYKLNDTNLWCSCHWSVVLLRLSTSVSKLQVLQNRKNQNCDTGHSLNDFSGHCRSGLSRHRCRCPSQRTVMKLKSNEWHQQVGPIPTKMQTSQLLQPDYSKHRWTIWQCRPVTFLKRTIM